MTSRIELVICVVCLIGSSAVWADHICTNSPNEAFIGYSQGGNGVAPMPICRWVEQQATAPQQKVVERWEVFDDRFGAIATATNGPYGASSDQRSREAAERLALEQCTQRGGMDCEVRGGAHMNSCTTFAWGGGMGAFESAPSSEASEREALEGCEADTGVRCEVIETVCSTPVSRWVYEKPDNWVPRQD